MIPSLRLYILLRLDSNLSGGGAFYEYDLLTTEHVLPQRPAAGSQWEKRFPNPSQRAQMRSATPKTSSERESMRKSAAIAGPRRICGVMG